MAFLDNPQVDESSKRSEESILAIKKFFSRKNGFISREEIPDYGVDLSCELILNGKEAAGKIFSIQVKSTITVKTIQKHDKHYIKYPGFETSRLGYILQRTPGMGLIILYEEENKNCYFDYIENIVSFITEDKGDEEWKQNGTTTIYLPVENIITLEKVNSIYQNMLNRFNNHDLLMKAHGKDYGLDFANSNPTNDLTELDESNPTALSKWLETYGFYLINLQDFPWLSDLIDKLRYQDIKNSKTLSFLAYVAYIQTEKIAEATLYMHRCKFYFDQYSKQEQEIIQVSDLKLQVYLGNLALNETFSKIENLLTSSQNKSVILSLKVWYSRLQVLIMYQNRDFNEDYFNQIQKVFSEIMDDNELEQELKFILTLQNTDSLFGLYQHNLLQAILNEEIHEKMFGKISENEKVSIWRPVFRLFKLLTDFLKSAITYAEEKDLKKLKALVMIRFAEYHWGQLLGFMHYKKSKYNWDEKTELLMESLRKNAMDAARIFGEIGLSKDGYKAICIAYEIIIFTEKVYKHSLCYSKQRVREYLSGTEKNLEIEEPYKSITQVHLEKLNKISQQPFNINIEGITDEDIEDHAKNILKSLKLPEERLDNLKLSIKNQIIFNKVNKNPYMSLRENTQHESSLDTYYAFPVPCFIYNKKTGIQTIQNSNVEKLIKQFSYLLNNK